MISDILEQRINACDGQFRLGVFGGTFDPIHLGHLILAQSAYEQFALDNVLLIPTGRPTRKLSSGFSDAEQRLAMTEAAVTGDERFAVSRLEIDRPGTTYTIDTIRALKAAWGDRVLLYLITGADAAADLPTWKGAAEIAAGLQAVLFARRPGTEQGELAQAAQLLDCEIAEISMPLIDISAMDLRKRIQTGRTLRYLVPEAVENYIRDTGLYQESA
ncbi:MAG: nicotinate-nucleotide adenylyltransferase [Coriobacteriales bacterium]|jgi:nicotinate-nucleotide adenylyltransferase|nr:nicotinate-nucleotide adenylyltransferase [Coriobacteriales bacterium]